VLLLSNFLNEFLLLKIKKRFFKDLNEKIKENFLTRNKPTGRHARKQKFNISFL